MEYSLQLRISAVFILFVASFLGVVIPLIYASYNREEDTLLGQQKMAESDGFRITRAFAAGIMLSVGFIHLLYDGVDKLSAVSLDYPSLGFTLATIGAQIVLGFEQVAIALIGRIDTLIGDVTKSGAVAPSTESKEMESANKYDQLELEVVVTPPCCDHNHAINMIAGSDSMSVIVKAYMMEISVAIHSVIIGIALGSLAGPDDLQSLQTLIVAICFHQFFEGLGLGTVIEGARLDLGMMKTIIFVFTFAITVPIGVVVGIVITDDQALENGSPDAQVYTIGCLNCLAAGIMIYIALVEMIAEDFKHAAIASNIGLKVKMFMALMGGTLCMAVLAIWA